jgi:restriction system protein
MSDEAANTNEGTEMNVPPLRVCFRPVLGELAKGCRSARESLPGLAAHFNLSNEAQEALLPSGSRTRLQDRAEWSILALLNAGLMRRVSRGVYEITPEGHDALVTGPEVFTEQYFRTFPMFRAWKEGKNAQGGAAPADTAAQSSTEDVEDTPQDRLRAAHAELDAALADELLDALRQTTPARFERLVVDLLIAMGYGKGDPTRARAIGKSGDGGIDGIVNEDALGLDAVYVQAKRYADGNTVGRPAVQGFVGSMTGESATKGVFVTTSAFSAGALEYVRFVQQRVVLIDGARLARLMIAHGVGVRVEEVFTTRSLDAQVFDEI